MLDTAAKENQLASSLEFARKDIKKLQKDFRVFIKKAEKILHNFFDLKREKLIDYKQGLAKYAILENGLIKVPKAVVAKVSNKKRGIKDKARSIRTFEEACLLPESEWRSMKIKKYFDMYDWLVIEDDDLKLTQKQTDYLSRTIRVEDNEDKYRWEIAVPETWMEAYCKIKSCMSGKKLPLYYLRHPESFLCLVCYLNDTPVARCVFLRFAKHPRYVMPVRIYTVDQELISILSGAGLTRIDTLINGMKYLNSQLSDFNVQIPAFFMNQDIYEDKSTSHPGIFSYRNLFERIKKEYYSLITFISPIISNQRMPYLDFIVNQGIGKNNYYAGMAYSKKCDDAALSEIIQKVTFEYSKFSKELDVIFNKSREIYEQE